MGNALAGNKNTREGKQPPSLFQINIMLPDLAGEGGKEMEMSVLSAEATATLNRMSSSQIADVERYIARCWRKSGKFTLLGAICRIVMFFNSLVPVPKNAATDEEIDEYISIIRHERKAGH